MKELVHPIEYINGFSIIFDDQINSFLEIVEDRYRNYIKEKNNDEIPSAASILDFECTMYSRSILHDFLDDNFGWLMHRDNPETFPEPESDEWVKGGFYGRVQEILCDTWENTEENYIHDVEVAFNILQITFEKDETKIIINSPVCEVW